MITTSIFQPTNGASSLSCPVLLGHKLNGGWTARVLGWTEVWAEGATREAALQNLSQQLQRQLAEAEIVSLEIPLDQAKTVDQNPWLQIAGKDADDPNWDEYMAAIVENRHEADLILEQSYQQIDSVQPSELGNEVT